MEHTRNREPEQRDFVRKKPINEERDLPRDPEKPLDADRFHSSEPTESPLKERSSYSEEPADPKIKEYQVKKWQEKTSETRRESKSDRTVESEPIKEKPIREHEPETSDRLSQSTPDPKEKFDTPNVQEEPVRADVKEYQVKKYREASKPEADQPNPDTRTVREKTVDVKELDSKAPSDHVRDCLSDIEPKEKAPEANATASQQRQYAMEKYRNAIKGRKERHSEERYEPKSTEPAAPVESTPA